MLKTKIRIGPNDDGQRMSLEDFDRAEGVEGYLYELNKGVIEVNDVPNPKHWYVLQEVRNQLIAYQLAHSELVHSVAGSNDAKILLGDHQSERHPDVSVYLTPPPEVDDVWSLWVPEIVVEIVSASSVKRDYQDKPPEYLDFGVMEYWIVDPLKQRMTALIRWRGTWKEKTYKPAQKYVTRQLPKFSLDLKRVFAAAAR